MGHERVLISGTRCCFYSALCLALIAFSCLLVKGAPPSYPDCAGSDVQYVVDLTQPTTEFPHFWEECVGSGHALLGMRSDWQAQLARAHAELGFQQVRFHGIFDDDMSTLLYLEDGVATYSFFNIDTVYDFLVSIGMRPLVELSFMPELIASGNQTIFHYKGNITPPSNYTQWADLITNFVSHLVDRYGIDEILTWSFEVWNEPNCGFWTGDQQEYFHLLQITYNAIKSVDSRIMVGGPATCQSQWLNDTIAFANSQGFELDFISTHEYPTDPLPALGPTNRDTLKNVLTLSREIVGPDTVLYYTEYNDGLYSPGFHDDPFAAAFVIKNVKDVRGLVQLFSFWTFSDIFEEGGFISTPFHQGFGMMTIHGVPKPSWRAFQLLHQAGTFLLNDTLLTVLPPGVNYTTVDVLATANQTSEGQISGFQILVTNHDVPPNVVNNQSVCLIVNLPESASSLSATFQQINQWNANPVVCWEEMGSPQYLNSTQVAQLNVCAELTPSNVEFGPSKYSPTAFSTIIEVPPEGVAAFTFTVSS